ncbi:MAG: protein kinase [Candidatus Eisenbacteria bacterium]|nr:protein kinase [Candidatus Eisenbacteria bacterium]
MGDVYRARDTRLGREVAIKTLPTDVAADPERRARFETEARAVAALSHPNILAIHDVGEEGGVTFTVAELVEGQTLRERLADGPLASARAASLAAQIAQGLAAAHDRGIVHRDLKPENVMITPDGRAKILDFGLARRDEAVTTSSRSLAPTVAASTQPGTVMGTVGYMAPEQVRGQVVDARADLFALGIVLYEMLAGRAPFLRESAADTMSAILREDPAPLSLAAPETPPALQRIVERCLEKQPAARFRTAADLAFALESLAHGSSSGAQTAIESRPASPRFQRLTYRNGHISAARFTPDGASVVFGATWDGRPFEVFTSRIGSADSRGLGLPAGSLLAMSASGEMALSLGFHHRSWMQPIGTLARASLAGGGVRPLQKDVVAADWSPDGKSMAVIRFRGNDCMLEYPPGKALFQTEGWLNRCRVSPDGSRVAFANHVRSGEGEAEVCVVDRDGHVSTLQRDIINLSGVAWSPLGRPRVVLGARSRQSSRHLERRSRRRRARRAHDRDAHLAARPAAGRPRARQHGRAAHEHLIERRRGCAGSGSRLVRRLDGLRLQRGRRTVAVHRSGRGREPALRELPAWRGRLARGTPRRRNRARNLGRRRMGARGHAHQPAWRGALSDGLRRGARARVRGSGHASLGDVRSRRRAPLSRVAAFRRTAGVVPLHARGRRFRDAVGPADALRAFHRCAGVARRRADHAAGSGRQGVRADLAHGGDAPDSRLRRERDRGQLRHHRRRALRLQRRPVRARAREARPHDGDAHALARVAPAGCPRRDLRRSAAHRPERLAPRVHVPADAQQPLRGRGAGRVGRHPAWRCATARCGHTLTQSKRCERRLGNAPLF